MSNKPGTHETDELIRRRMQVNVPPDVEERLRQRLVEFQTKVEQYQPSWFERLAASLTQTLRLRAMSAAGALALVVVAALVLLPGRSGANRVFAAAAAHLSTSQSLSYTIVLNEKPYVAVDFSYLAPKRRRINCSWGIEVRADGNTGKQLVLMHGTQKYLAESGKQIESIAGTDDIAEQLKSLPPAADEVLGEQWTGSRKLLGYRLRKAPPNGGIPGLKTLDIWIDAGTQTVHHADITVQEDNKPSHRMHIQNVRVDAAMDSSAFDLTPPAGYTAIALPGATVSANPPSGGADTLNLPARIAQAGELTAVVIPMKGPYAQTQAALEAVKGYLHRQGITPAGPPLGRFWSEQHWEAGYPVPAGTPAEEPFQAVVSPAGPTASVTVNGPWGQDSSRRWESFLKSVIQQGYLPAGPAMEIWSGDGAQPVAQTTEMRIPIKKAN